jgi:hypothetical protein
MTEGRMSEFDRLVARLKDMGAVQFSAFPGTNLEATVEERAKAVNDALDALGRGDFEIVGDDEI